MNIFYAAGSYVGIKLHPPPLLLLHIPPQSPIRLSSNTLNSWKISSTIADSSSFVSSSRKKDRTVGGHLLLNKGDDVSRSRKAENEKSEKRRVFFLDVNPLCYKGSTPSLHSFAHWISLFFSQVSLHDPVIAVIDGERSSEYRRKILPSYKANRRKFSQDWSTPHRFVRNPIRRSEEITSDFLKKCNIPVLKIEGNEADDVVATLVEQVLKKGHQVVIASPDKDFKQLISEDVQIVMPMPDLGRWSFYTLKHYIAQYNCDPCSDLSLRCIMGDEVDGVPGIQHFVPGFGRKTAIKLLQKHGSLDNLLNAAAVRTVAKPYAQDALTKYADYLRKNYEVLSLRRDIDVELDEKWLLKRDTSSDAVVLSNFKKLLQETRNLKQQKQSLSHG